MLSDIYHSRNTSEQNQGWDKSSLNSTVENTIVCPTSYCVLACKLDTMTMSMRTCVYQTVNYEELCLFSNSELRGSVCVLKQFTMRNCVCFQTFNKDESCVFKQWTLRNCVYSNSELWGIVCFQTVNYEELCVFKQWTTRNRVFSNSELWGELCLFKQWTMRSCVCFQTVNCFSLSTFNGMLDAILVQGLQLPLVTKVCVWNVLYWMCMHAVWWN